MGGSSWGRGGSRGGGAAGRAGMQQAVVGSRGGDDAGRSRSRRGRIRRSVVGSSTSRGAAASSGAEDHSRGVGKHVAAGVGSSSTQRRLSFGDGVITVSDSVAQQQQQQGVRNNTSRHPAMGGGEWVLRGRAAG